MRRGRGELLVPGLRVSTLEAICPVANCRLFFPNWLTVTQKVEVKQPRLKQFYSVIFFINKAKTNLHTEKNNKNTKLSMGEGNSTPLTQPLDPPLTLARFCTTRAVYYFLN